MLSDFFNLRKNKRILIIEDDMYIRDLYRELLSAEGYVVTVAADGIEGYQMMNEGGYDLVLLDLMLPWMSGMTILERLKKNPPKKINKAIVILTNIMIKEAIADSVGLGIRGYMIKSNYTPENFLKEIKSYLV